MEGHGEAGAYHTLDKSSFTLTFRSTGNLESAENYWNYSGWMDHPEDILIGVELVTWTHSHPSRAN